MIEEHDPIKNPETYDGGQPSAYGIMRRIGSALRAFEFGVLEDGHRSSLVATKGGKNYRVTIERI